MFIVSRELCLLRIEMMCELGKEEKQHYGDKYLQ